MSIDWRVLITTGSASAAIFAAAVFALKRTFETVLASAAKRIEEDAKIATAEAIRRQAAVFDQQLLVLKTCAAAVYRARNAARDLRDLAAKGAQTVPDAERLQSHHAALRELLYQEVAVLPENIFSMLHTQGHNLAKLEEAIRESELTVSESGPISSNRDIERTYLDIDRTYERLIAAVHDHLGIHSKDS
jgi:septation ring formation regulator EzrA